MADWPGTLTLPDGLITIIPASANSIGGSYGGSLGTIASTAYPASNRAIYVPFRLTSPFLVALLFAYNGAAVSGNIDVGIYDSAGTRLVSTGSTAQAGTSVIQTFDITDTLLGAGLFYLATAMDNTTGTLFRWPPTTTFTVTQGLAQQATAFPLPALATMATYSSGYIPLVGACARSFV